MQVGEGGYGNVYQGILDDGRVVAIKRAQQGSLQGQNEFFTEIELLSRLHHRNLVSLLGYCIEQNEQMLVYEFMPNGTLRNLLSARYNREVSFGMRVHIALGAAKGILYLHTEADPPIIHRDIKSNNILLDSKYTPKVADFGISRRAHLQDRGGATASSTAVKGTPGYVDPDYCQTQQLTDKSDVYSLGVVFLELLTGLPAIFHGKHLVQEVLAASESGNMLSTIDESMTEYTSECVKKFMELALKCCEEERQRRPSMLEVVRELENISVLMLEESDAMASESAEASSSQMPPPYFKRKPFTPSDFPGSDLDSGVVPTTKPR